MAGFLRRSVKLCQSAGHLSSCECGAGKDVHSKEDSKIHVSSESENTGDNTEDSPGVQTKQDKKQVLSEQKLTSSVQDKSDSTTNSSNIDHFSDNFSPTLKSSPKTVKTSHTPEAMNKSSPTTSKLRNILQSPQQLNVPTSWMKHSENRAVYDVDENRFMTSSHKQKLSLKSEQSRKRILSKIIEKDESKHEARKPGVIDIHNVIDTPTRQRTVQLGGSSRKT
ncbi:MAG: hypothetical protein M1827_006268 [Pycnora praestabilis]|nr:MAG: hypothetical protein M1827_006268 [Pycnora praestabilis]